MNANIKLPESIYKGDVLPRFNNIHDAIRNNEKRDCSVKSCHRKRYRVGALCENCGKQRWLWGHPEARAVFKRDYRYEKRIVQKVIDKNLEHDGIQHGINFIEVYLNRSGEGTANHLPGHEHAKRLHNANADAVNILVELAAIYMLSRNYHTPVKDHRHLKYLLGSKFIRFVPCQVKVRGTEHRDVGEYINENIGVLLLNIAKSAHKMVKEEEA
jgi:hypothetical protein